jgi:hypothetical protein
MIWQQKKDIEESHREPLKRGQERKERQEKKQIRQPKNDMATKRKVRNRGI